MKKKHHQPDSPHKKRSGDTPFQQLNGSMASSNTIRSSQKEHSPISTGKISRSEPFAGIEHWKLSSEDNRHEAPPLFLGVLHSPESPTAPDTQGPGVQNTATETENLSRPTWKLAKPRVSPMEYARMYLIEKSLAERENRECRLPRYDTEWFWTQNHEKFLIIPRIPDNIRRDMMSDDFHSVTGTDTEASSGEQQVSTPITEKHYTRPMRLSLHLGNNPDLFPLSTGKSYSNGGHMEAPHIKWPNKGIESCNSVDVPDGKDLAISHRGESY
jgi:hypothetical protein